MKKVFLPLLALLFLGGLLSAPLVGDLQGQTLDEVLAKNYQARGGLEKLKSITARKMSGNVVLTGLGTEMPIVLWQKAPGKLRIETTFQDQKVIQAFDGQKAWWVTPFLAGKALEMPPDQGAFFRGQAVFEDPLIVFKEKGDKVELLGKEDMEGTPVFKLKLTRADGGEVYFYLDAVRGIELKSTMSLKTDKAEALAEIIYSDFRDVSGCLLPFAIENKLDGKTEARMTLDAIEVNPAMDDSLFAMPAAMETPGVQPLAPEKERKKLKKR